MYKINNPLRMMLKHLLQIIIGKSNNRFDADGRASMSTEQAVQDEQISSIISIDERRCLRLS